MTPQGTDHRDHPHPLSQEAQADAIRELVLDYDAQRQIQQQSWLTKLWHGHGELDALREELINRVMLLAHAGGNVDLTIPVAREGRPPRMVPIVDFFLASQDGLDVAETLLRVGARFEDSSARLMGRMALATGGGVPPLFEHVIEQAVRRSGIDWQQTIRGDGDKHGREIHIDAALERACPRFRTLLGWAMEARGEEPLPYYPDTMTPQQATDTLMTLVSPLTTQDPLPRCDRLRRVQELLQKGANPDGDGRLVYHWDAPLAARPLLVAAMDLDAMLVETLVKHGAGVEDVHGHIALNMALHAQQQASGMTDGEACERLVATLQALNQSAPAGVDLDRTVPRYTPAMAQDPDHAPATARELLQVHMPGALERLTGEIKASNASGASPRARRMR